MTHAGLVSNTNAEEYSVNGPSEIQNNIDTFWMWAINGFNITGSLSIFTGSIKIIQAVLEYWHDEVLT